MLQSGRTALYYAAWNGDDQCCEVLLEAGASVDIQDMVSLA